MFASGRRLIHYVGNVALTDIKNSKYREAVDAFCKNQEAADPRIKKAEIKGSNPHKSHDDPSDPEDVISIRFKDENDSRLGTAHIHEDGSGKVKWKK